METKPNPVNTADSSSLDPKKNIGISGVKKIVYLCIAGLFFVLGALGAILPVLPATPFLLLSSFFLVRTSPKLNEKLLRSKFFGPILEDWQKRGGVRKDVKYQAIAMVVLVVSISILVTAPTKWITLSIASLALIGIFVIIRLPIAREDHAEEIDQNNH